MQHMDSGLSDLTLSVQLRNPPGLHLSVCNISDPIIPLGRKSTSPIRRRVDKTALFTLSLNEATCAIVWYCQLEDKEQEEQELVLSNIASFIPGGRPFCLACVTNATLEKWQFLFHRHQIQYLLFQEHESPSQVMIYALFQLSWMRSPPFDLGLIMRHVSMDEWLLPVQFLMNQMYRFYIVTETTLPKALEVHCANWKSVLNESEPDPIPTSSPSNLSLSPSNHSCQQSDDLWSQFLPLLLSLPKSNTGIRISTLGSRVPPCHWRPLGYLQFKPFLLDAEKEGLVLLEPLHTAAQSHDKIVRLTTRGRDYLRRNIGLSSLSALDVSSTRNNTEDLRKFHQLPRALTAAIYAKYGEMKREAVPISALTVHLKNRPWLQHGYDNMTDFVLAAIKHGVLDEAEESEEHLKIQSPKNGSYLTRHSDEPEISLESCAVIVRCMDQFYRQTQCTTMLLSQLEEILLNETAAKEWIQRYGTARRFIEAAMTRGLVYWLALRDHDAALWLATDCFQDLIDQLRVCFKSPNSFLTMSQLAKKVKLSPDCGTSSLVTWLTLAARLRLVTVHPPQGEKEKVANWRVAPTLQSPYACMTRYLLMTPVLADS